MRVLREIFGTCIYSFFNAGIFLVCLFWFFISSKIILKWCEKKAQYFSTHQRAWFIMFHIENKCSVSANMVGNSNYPR